MLELIREIRQNRELIWALALKELVVMRIEVKSYAIFLLSTLLPWTFFSQGLSYAVESIVGNGDLLKKIYVGKSIFPIAAVLSNVINFLLSLIPLVLVLIALRFPFHWTWVYLPIPLLGLVLFTLGCGFTCAAANVFFRDVSHIIQIVLSAWFYASPIIYSMDFIPQQYHLFFRLNPMLYILNGFRLAIYYGQLPTPQSAAMSLGCGLAALVVGYLLFRRHQDEFVFYV
jgi:ABC-type polysaccharide/polyol phosphate export permease